MIRPVTLEDSASIANIYNHFITNTVVTFEEQSVSAEEINRRIDVVQSAGLPYLVAEQDDKVVGYAYASKWKDRSAYRFSVETTIYLDPEFVGQGLGMSLYEALLVKLKDAGVHVALGGIALPNHGSVALHEKLGFKKVAHFNEVGFKFDQWIDTGYWQRIL